MAVPYAGKFEDLRKPPTSYRNSTGHRRTARPKEVGRVFVLHPAQRVGNILRDRHVDVFTGFLLIQTQPSPFQAFHGKSCCVSDPQA
jgi:hypothetical protein